LAGGLYPDGIPIFHEHELVSQIKEHSIDLVVFAYSDVPYQYVMSKGAEVNAAGADFTMPISRANFAITAITSLIVSRISRLYHNSKSQQK
jgi:predicted GTPase